MHLIMDGHSDNIELMTDRDMMRKFMRETVALADMSPFGEPYCQGYPWAGSEDWSALTCFQPLGESGLVIHTFPEKQFVFIDLFSCKDFKVGAVEGHIVRSFRMRRCKVVVLGRGINKDGSIIPAYVISNSDKEYGI